MQSKEQLIASESSYFVYAPSRNAQEMFLYHCSAGGSYTRPGTASPGNPLTASC